MLLRELLQRAESATPDNTIVEGAKVDAAKEKVAGVLPEELKKLAMAVMGEELVLRTALAQIRGEILTISPGNTFFLDKVMKLEERCPLAMAKFKAVEDLFWAEVRLAIPGLANATHLGLREGWQVVIHNNEVCPNCGQIHGEEGEDNVRVVMMPMGHAFDPRRSHPDLLSRFFRSILG